MDNRGISLFQGGESINLDPNANRAEEEEALEDQRRRKEELDNDLQNGFQDITFDDEHTEDSASHFNMNSIADACPIPIESRKHHAQYLNHEQCYKELEKLKIALESKVNENKNITEMVHQERQKVEELSKRLALAEAERDRYKMGKEQEYELLVESKTKVSDMEDTIQKLKNKIKSLESDNGELAANLERTQNLLADAQYKYNIVEKTRGTFNSDRQADNILKQANERHTAQIDMMQHQIDNLRTKLEDKDVELQTLDKRFKELQRSREALLIEKTETINQLAENLQDSQSRCQQLMARQDNTQENIRLRKLVSSLEQQAEDMQRTINTLSTRLDIAETELKIMDNVLMEGTTDDMSSPRRLSLNKNNFVGSTPMTFSDKLTRLQTELKRSFDNQKEKRDEIRKLQEQLASKNEEIKMLKDQENAALVEINTFREENIRLKNKLKILENEIEDVRYDKRKNNQQVNFYNDEEYKQLNNKIQLLEQELINAKKEHEVIKERNNYLKSEAEDLRKILKSKENDFEIERKKITSQLKNLNIDIEELKQERDNIKTNYESILKEKESKDSNNELILSLEKYKFLLKDAQTENDRLKNLYSEISDAKETLSIELAKYKAGELNEEILQHREKCANLERALQLAELKATELKRLLEIEKLSHEKEINEIREKYEKEKADSSRSSKNSSVSCSKCIEHKANITKLEIKILTLESQYSLHIKELNVLRQQLGESKNVIADLCEKLSLKEERDRLIEELKYKAQQFEDYCIKNQNNSSSATSGISSPKLVEKCDQSVETTPELELNQNRHILESKIRDEMGKIYAKEIKNLESRYNTILQNFQKQNMELKEDMQKINSELILRQKDVCLLTEAIIAERKEMGDKEYQNQEVIQKQTIMLQKYHDELIDKQKEIDEIKNELEEREQQFDKERQSMKAVMIQYEEQINISESKEQELKKSIYNLKRQQERLQSKLLCEQQTLEHTKKYSNALKRHYEQELSRMSENYKMNLESEIRKISEKIKGKNTENKKSYGSTLAVE